MPVLRYHAAPRTIDRRFLNVSDIPRIRPGRWIPYSRSSRRPRAFADYRPTVHLRDPWVVTLDSFLTDAEVDGLLNANGLSFVRSTDTGAYDAATGANKKIVSQHRTSSNAWCVGECERAPATRSIHRKIAEVVDINVPWKTSKSSAASPGQYYKAHHDYIERDGATPAGPRVLTFFLYLSDVDEGGEAARGKLGVQGRQRPLCIKPKRVRAARARERALGLTAQAGPTHDAPGAASYEGRQVRRQRVGAPLQLCGTEPMGLHRHLRLGEQATTATRGLDQRGGSACDNGDMGSAFEINRRRAVAVEVRSNARPPS